VGAAGEFLARLDTTIGNGTLSGIAAGAGSVTLAGGSSAP
jgi:hypothetical protein